MSERPLSILVVDDDDIDVMTVKRCFAKANVQNPVVVARDGIEALTALRSGTFERLPLVLLDINMPRMNGIELLREIRRDPILSDLKVVVLTTSNEDRDRVNANRLGITSYLVKPVTFSSFADSVSGLGTAWNLVTA